MFIEKEHLTNGHCQCQVIPAKIGGCLICATKVREEGRDRMVTVPMVESPRHSRVVKRQF